MDDKGWPTIIIGGANVRDCGVERTLMILNLGLVDQSVFLPVFTNPYTINLIILIKGGVKLNSVKPERLYFGLNNGVFFVMINSFVLCALRDRVGGDGYRNNS